MKKVLTLLVTLFPAMGFAQKFTDLALTPPMGWNSWNTFACNVTEKIVMDAADALVTSGMKDAGYQYVVIDDCWQVDRDSLGFLVADKDKFPSGIKTLADYVHGKGLKFGIYSCAGRLTCQKRPGSRGHEYQDAITFAQWGVDFLKQDWCNSNGQNAEESYALMRDALYSAGRPVVFSICEWGLNKPWEWAADVGHAWRTTGDIRDNWNIPDAKYGKCWGGGVVINLDMQEGLEKFSGPGHWNDPDMLEVGNGMLTPAESRAHFSLWCMLSAPLFAGNDLVRMSAETKAILTNNSAISINQDVMGKQGYKIADYGEFEIYYKPLTNGKAAICLFNRLDQPIAVDVDILKGIFKVKSPMSKLIKDANSAKADNVDFSKYKEALNAWSNESIALKSGSRKYEIDAHDVVLMILSR